MIRVVVCLRSVPGITVARTSTRVPGRTNPATPMTSSTSTDSARIPSGIVMGSPPPASLSAIFQARRGSFFRTSTTKPRPTTSPG